MADEPQKVSDLDKNDPQYKIKVNQVVRNRLEREKAEAKGREQARMGGGLVNRGRKQPLAAGESKPGTAPQPPINPVVPGSAAQNTPMPRNPEDVVYVKDIQQLVAKLNGSLGAIEKRLLALEDFQKKLSGAVKEK